MTNDLSRASGLQRRDARNKRFDQDFLRDHALDAAFRRAAFSRRAFSASTLLA